MQAAIIEDGIVANVIEVETLDFLPGLVDGTNAAIGDGWDGTRFIKPAPLAPVVPDRIPMLNAHLVMIEAGWMDPVNAYIDGLPELDAAKARAYLNMAQTMERSHPLVQAIAAAIGKTEAEVDQLFIAAAALNV